MQTHFEKKLAQINEKLIRMATLAEEMLKSAIGALISHDGSPIADVYRKEDVVNNLQIEIDEDVIGLMARMQPVAGDLRFLVAASKITGELERIADQAVNICQNTSYLLQYPQLKPFVDTPVMADLTEQMMVKSLTAFVKRDADLAREVLESDDKVDAFKDQIFRELLTYMISDSQTIPRALAIILIARNLERVADYATNIAEEVIYLVQGRDVRHRHEEKTRKNNG